MKSSTETHRRLTQFQNDLGRVAFLDLLVGRPADVDHSSWKTKGNSKDAWCQALNVSVNQLGQRTNEKENRQSLNHL